MGEESREEEQRELRARRIARMKREKQRQEQMRRRMRLYLGIALGCICVMFLIVAGFFVRRTKDDLTGEEVVSTDKTAGLISQSGASDAEAQKGEAQNDEAQKSAAEAKEEDATEGEDAAAFEAENAEGAGETAEPDGAAASAESSIFYAGYAADITENTPYISSEDVISSYAILLDLDTGEVVAQREARTVISPASMTKILTLLVAAEHTEDLDDTFTMTLEMTDYAYMNDCSTAGFLEDETVTIRDLMYGTILPSGGEAAAALAIYTAGTLDAFVDMMNDKLEELGLSDTAHFTNCVGLYDEDHHCSVYDMAMILKAAAENEICREVLSAHTYTTSATEQHPEGILLSNWFLRRIEDKDTHGEVICAKTGFVNQSGNCGASYAISNSGGHYICVTGDAWSAWRCIYDHVAIYQEYTD